MRPPLATRQPAGQRARSLLATLLAAATLVTTSMLPDAVAVPVAQAQTPDEPKPSIPLDPVPPRDPIVRSSMVGVRSPLGRGVWTPPVNVSASAGSSVNPSIGVNRALNVEVIWGEVGTSNGGLDGFVEWSQKGAGGAFTEPAVLNTRSIESYEYFTRIAVDPERHVTHAVWGTCDTTPNGSPIFYANRLAGSSTWNFAVQVHQAGNCPNLTIDNDGAVHVVFEAVHGQVGGGSIWYFKVPLGGFISEPERVAPELTRSHHPVVLVTQDGTRHVAWSEYLDGDGGTTNSEIYYAWAEPGRGWNPWKNLSENSAPSDWPALAADFRSAVTIAWQDGSQCPYPNNDIFSRFHFARGEWTPIANLSNMCNREGQMPLNSQYPSIAVDVLGNVHLVWQAGSIGNSYNSEIYYAAKPFDGAWFAPMNISNTPGSSRRPQVAVDPLQNPHVVWEDNTPGNFDVFYSFDAPRLGLGSSQVGFLLAPSDSTSRSQTVEIRNDGDGLMSWTATTDQPWLRLSVNGSTPAASVSATEPGTLTIHIDAAQVPIGQTVTGSITVDAGIADDSPQTISVSAFRGELQRAYLPALIVGSQAGW